MKTINLPDIDSSGNAESVPESEPWMDSGLPAGSDWTHEITKRLLRARWNYFKEHHDPLV